MTTRHPEATYRKERGKFVLPDVPEREPEDMTSFDHLALNGGVHHLAQRLGNLDTTVVGGERYVIREPGAPASERVAPDLLIAFNANPPAFQDSNGYIISEQGKPPDFVMEVGSRSTGRNDATGKRTAYAGLGVPEYWRFDETGAFQGARLAGDRLAGDEYEPIPIETIEEGVLQGYSRVLNLIIRWDHGRLGWHDPETGEHIATFTQEQARAEEERTRADAAEARAEEERTRADAAEARAEEERTRADARIRELEAELERRKP